MKEKKNTLREHLRKQWEKNPNKPWNPVFQAFEEYSISIFELNEKTGIPLEELAAMADKPRNWNPIFEGNEREQEITMRIGKYLLPLITQQLQESIKEFEETMRERWGNKVIDEILDDLSAETEIRKLLKESNVFTLPSEEEITTKIQQILQSEINEIQRKTGFNANLANPRYAGNISKSIITELKRLGVLKI